MRDMESLISECKSDQGAQPTLHPLGPSTPFPILVNGTCGSLMHFSSLQLKCKPPIWPRYGARLARRVGSVALPQQISQRQIAKCATVEGSIFTASSCICIAYIMYWGNMVRSWFSPLPSF